MAESTAGDTQRGSAACVLRAEWKVDQTRGCKAPPCCSSRWDWWERWADGLILLCGGWCEVAQGGHPMGRHICRHTHVCAHTPHNPLTPHPKQSSYKMYLRSFCCSCLCCTDCRVLLLVHLGVNLLVARHLALSFRRLGSVTGSYSPCIAPHNSSLCAVGVFMRRAFVWIPTVIPGVVKLWGRAENTVDIIRFAPTESRERRTTFGCVKSLKRWRFLAETVSRSWGTDWQHMGTVLPPHALPCAHKVTSLPLKMFAVSSANPN